MNTELQYRLIKKTFSYIPIEGRLYRRVEILEEVIQIPTIDLTDETIPSGDRESRKSSSEEPTDLSTKEARS